MLRAGCSFGLVFAAAVHSASHELTQSHALQKQPAEQQLGNNSVHWLQTADAAASAVAAASMSLAVVANSNQIEFHSASVADNCNVM